MTDRSFGLFEPDALLPAQFYAAFRGGSAVRGEKRLMLAVLEDALDCFQKYAFARDGHGRQLFDESMDWISSSDRDWFFSFENICETLEINPEYLRRGLDRWRSRGDAAMAAASLPHPEKAKAEDSAALLAAG
jgi:hypothetical protein